MMAAWHSVGSIHIGNGITIGQRYFAEELLTPRKYQSCPEGHSDWLTSPDCKLIGSVFSERLNEG